MLGPTSSHWSRLIAATILCLRLLSSGAGGALASEQAPVQPEVLAQLAEKGQAAYWVILDDQADLSAASGIADWGERGAYVYDTLTAHAAATQAGLLADLDHQGVSHESYWILNSIRVTSGKLVLDALRSHPGVREIRADAIYSIPRLQPAAAAAQVDGVEWNIDRIRAPDVWSHFGVRGEDIVVANIDTGVEYTHSALVGQYRGRLASGAFQHDYNWYDTVGDCGLAPCDPDGHGTHTMGTMVGDDGGANKIGAAPGARWIAVTGCMYYGCYRSDLTAAAQWIVAPTNLSGLYPRPDLRPHVVNNSWGGEWFDPWYQAYVRAWVAAGIFPAFSAGNDGAACSTVGSPGDYVESYSTGAFEVAGNIAEFSSRGPAVDGAAKPDIAAPGANVRSSIPGNDYRASSGTSMASPHTAATVALMWSAAPALVGDIAQTMALLDQSAVDVADLTCGGQPGNNNVWGEGRLDAYTAVELAPREEAGLLMGTVTDASTGLPVEGATVELSGRMTRRLTTDAAGHYQARLASGVYDALASKYGYGSQSVTGLILYPGAELVSDFALQIVPAHRLEGYVRDTTGNPISDASVVVVRTPLAPAITDANGYYSFAAILEGTQTIDAAAGRCANPQSRTVDVTGPISDFDFALTLRTDAFGYSCVPYAPGYIEGDAPLALSGDDSYAEIGLPFSFPFYDGRYTRLWVGTNGTLGFGEPSSVFWNTDIPSADLPNNAIFAFWDDLYVDYFTTSMYTRLVEAPRRFVIEWRGVEFYSMGPPPPDFEVILYQDGQIVLQYRNVGATSRQQGGSATIGIENSNGSDGLAYSYNSAALRSPVDAIRYRSPSSIALDNIIYFPLVLRHSQ